MHFCAGGTPYASVTEFRDAITPEEIDAAEAAFTALLVAQGVDVSKLRIEYVGVDVTEGCSLNNGGRLLQASTHAFAATFSFVIYGPSTSDLQVHDCIPFHILTKAG